MLVRIEEQGFSFDHIEHDDGDLWFMHLDHKDDIFGGESLMIKITEEQVIEMVHTIHERAKTFKGCGQYYKVFPDLKQCDCKAGQGCKSDD